MSSVPWRRMVALVAAACLSFTLAAPGTVRAYHLDDHPSVVSAALDLLDIAELNDHASELRHGAKDEDETDHVYGLTCDIWNIIDPGWCFCVHFWDADGNHGNGPGGPHDGDKCVWPFGDDDCYNNAFEKAGTLTLAAIDLYRAGNKAAAYERLGHAAHLLADMTVPGHAHEDYYGSEGHDDYESWIEDNGIPDTADPVDPVLIPSAEGLRVRISELKASGGATITDDMLTWPDSYLRFYYLFYTANQRADYFDSPDYGGDSVEPYGWVDYASFPADRSPAKAVMADYLWVYAIRATASLFQLFLQEVDSTPPTITIVTPQPSAALPYGTALEFSAVDEASGLASVEGQLSDESGTVTVASGFQPEPGAYTLVVTATDNAGNVATERREFVVYDPAGGFATGGGWIRSVAGAWTADPTVAGKGLFELDAKYLKGDTLPTGSVEFRVRAAGLEFASSSFDWLVVNRAATYAQVQGVGTIAGTGDYGFRVWLGNGTPDTFRIRIWDTAAGDAVIYDSGALTALGGGAIRLHAD